MPIGWSPTPIGSPPRSRRRGRRAGRCRRQVFATQASCGPSEMPWASAPTGIVAVGSSSGSDWRRWSWSLEASTTQTVPLPAAIWSGFDPTSTGSPNSSSVLASIACSVPSRAWETKTLLAVDGDPSGPSPTRIVSVTCGWSAASSTSGVVVAVTCGGWSAAASFRRRTRRPHRARPTASAATSRSGSATSSATRRPFGQPAGPAGSARGPAPRLRRGVRAPRRGRGEAWRRPTAAACAAPGCRARAAPARGLAGGDRAGRRRGGLALQRGPARRARGRPPTGSGRRAPWPSRVRDHRVERGRDGRGERARGGRRLVQVRVQLRQRRRRAGTGRGPVSAWKSTQPSA